MVVIRVKLPINKPDDTLVLCNRIKNKHLALGVNSPLTGFVNMTNFATRLTNATNLRNDGNLRTETQQKKYEKACVKAGVGKGQTKNTKDTVYWHVQKVRNALANKFKGTEEELSEFGFNVVVTQSGSRRNVRIRLPYSSVDDMVKLGEDIVAQHTLLGVGSPLNGVDTVDIATLTTLTTEARTLLDEWAVAKGEAQSFHHQAMVLIGYGAGQTSFTQNTLYYDVCQVRDRLLDVNQETEEELSEFGFDVVVRVARKRKKKSRDAIVREGDVAFPGTANIDLTEVNPPLDTTVLFTVTGSAMRFYASANPGEAPQPTTAFFTVQPGQNIEKTIADVIIELGLGTNKPYLNVENFGGQPGHFVVTIG